MRPAFVNFRKEHTVFGFLFLVHMTVFAYFLQLYIPFSSMSWLEPTSFDDTHTSCNQLSGAIGWNMRILQQECRLENKDVSRERKQEGNLPAQPTHPPTRAGVKHSVPGGAKRKKGKKARNNAHKVCKQVWFLDIGHQQSMLYCISVLSSR